MLKDHFMLFRRFALVVDLVVVFFSFLAASLIQFRINDYYAVSEYIQLLFIIMPIWAVTLYYFGMYTAFRTKDATDIIYVTSRAALVGFIVYGSLHYIFKMPYFSRSYISIIFLIAGYTICVEKIALLIIMKSIYKKGFNARNILVVGTGPRAEKFIQLIQKHSGWGIKIIGLVDREQSKVGKEFYGYPVLGTFENIPDILQNNIIDEVAFVVPRSWLDKIEESIHFCENRGVRVHVALDIFNPMLTTVRQTDIDGFPLLTFEHVPYRLSIFAVKRCFDIVAASLILIIFSPVLLFTGVLLKIKDPSGSIFVRRARVGFNGRQFWLYKFKTDEQETDELFFASRTDEGVVKSKGLNKVLRRFHIDDLPQFWNVITGDLSMIGPRAATPEEVAKYQPWQKRKLSMRPGVICLWFLRPVEEIRNFEERIRLDLRYVDNWSPWLDLTILIKVVPVLFGLRIFKEKYV